jgi:zinc/manganese transport system permease protein
MIDFLEIMTKPLVACLVLAGIHVYLGLHVVRRGIIFVDLALAQVAAFGTTMGLLFDFDIHGPSGHLCGMAFTIVGAGIFTLSRSRSPVVPQEALIGIVYAVAAAAAILVLSRAPEGGEELKAILVGHLLFVDWPEIVTVLVLYMAVAAIHWWARKPLFLISEDPERAYAQGLRVRWWDFLFYASFGVVVTTAVQIAGVLLVFAFLIVPAVCAVFLTESALARLFVGWLVAVFTSVIGIGASFHYDLPTGATIVCAFGAVLLVCGGLRRIVHG